MSCQTAMTSTYWWAKNHILDILTDENIHSDVSCDSSLSFFVAQIVFDNHALSGKITVHVENDARIYECRDWNVEGTCKFVKELILLKRSAGDAPGTHSAPVSYF